MCETYNIRCECGQRSAEIFFGKMLLDHRSLRRLYCPDCSGRNPDNDDGRVIDNGWILELNMDRIRKYGATFGISSDDITANWVFDNGYVTWSGITPDDNETRNCERAAILELAKNDMQAYFKAMKEWGRDREKRFIQQGWRKMQC